jgi:TatD DNase family protein
MVDEPTLAGKPDSPNPMLPLIDTHCHLAAPELDGCRADVIARAKDAGVVAVVCVGEHYEDNLRVLDLAASEPFVRPALGHHPWYLDRAAADLERTLALIEDHVSDLVAIGEVGLDYRVAESAEDRQRQQDVFRELIAAGTRHQLPLSVHVRSAGHYVIDLLQELENSNAALHAFDGKAKYASAGAAWGLYFSLPGTLLVSRQKEKLARVLPLERLLLESDTPALSPEPGKPSEPALLAKVVERVAELRGVETAAVAQAAFDNACRLFRLEL